MSAINTKFKMAVVHKRRRDLLSDFPTLSPILGISKTAAECTCLDLYNTFELKPRGSHNTRSIDAPCPHLKLLQRALLDRVLANVEPHDAAMAFAPGKSIAANARRHHGAHYLFKTDIQAFFPSITAKHVRSMLELRFRHLSSAAQQEIVALVTHRERLPQGAPTSPHIANLVMHEFDERTQWLSDRLGAVYTRYADDISISACNSDDLRHLEKIIRDGLSALGMKIKLEKNYHFGPHQPKIVTGLDIGGERIRPTRVFRKKVASLVRMTVKYPEQMVRHGDRLRGYFAFWYGIDPSDPDLARLLEQIGLKKWASNIRDNAKCDTFQKFEDEIPF